MTRRVCPTPGCPQLTDGGACVTHRRANDKARGTRQQRGYDAAYDRLRTQYQRRMDAGEAFTCWRPDCDRRIDPKHWHLGHDDLDRGIIRGPECPACNLRAAGLGPRTRGGG